MCIEIINNFHASIFLFEKSRGWQKAYYRFRINIRKKFYYRSGCLEPSSSILSLDKPYDISMLSQISFANFLLFDLAMNNLAVISGALRANFETSYIGLCSNSQLCSIHLAITSRGSLYPTMLAKHLLSHPTQHTVFWIPGDPAENSDPSYYLLSSGPSLPIEMAEKIPEDGWILMWFPVPESRCRTLRKSRILFTPLIAELRAVQKPYSLTSTLCRMIARAICIVVNSFDTHLLFTSHY